jgi:sarcosine oxidase
VDTDGGALRCGAVIFCADAWTNRLLEPLGHRVGLAVTREQVSYFPSLDRRDDVRDLAIGAFPVWIWMDDPSFYGFPTYGPAEVADRVKGSEDCGGELVDPDTRTFEPDEQMERRLAAFMTGLLGDRFGPPATTTCLYSLTPDRDFVLDRLPDHPNVAVGLGAAHGFKFASWFGRRLASLAGGEPPGDDLAAFAIDRAGIDAPISRDAWLV